MKATIAYASALLGTALTVCLASAAPYCSPVLHVYLQAAPDACGPGFYTVCPNGAVFGPNYWLRPPGEPYNGPFKTVTVNVGQKLMADKLGPPPGGGPGAAPNGQRPYGPYGPYGPNGPAMGQNPGPSYGPFGPNPPNYAYNPNLPNPGYTPNLPTTGYNPNLAVPAYGAPPTQDAAGFPTHPYVRSPRDFFMWRENMEDQLRRDQRPALVP